MYDNRKCTFFDGDEQEQCHLRTLRKKGGKNMVLFLKAKK